MKSFFQNATLLAALTVGANAALITESTRVFSTPVTIDDLQDPPLVVTGTIEDSLVVFITQIEVGLRLIGVEEGAGFASEMFVSLNKDLGATSVLLNQVGRSPEDSIGAFYDGWDVTFSDSAANGDVHQAVLSSGILQGLWQPDARTDPNDSSRPMGLGVFNGGSGNGVWRLALGDLEMGGQMRLESWSLSITGFTAEEPAAVPEPSAILGGAVLAILAFRARIHGASRRKNRSAQ